MKGILSVFSWVASALLEGLCPGAILTENIFDGLKRYNEDPEKIANSMQKGWMEAIQTLKIALGDSGWLTPKSRKMFGEKFAKEVVTPFALRHKLSGKRLEVFMQKALEQCKQLETHGEKIVNFTSFDQKTLVEGLADVRNISASKDEIGGLLIERIQNSLPDAKELLELLWYRNLLLEGLIAHFNLELSRNSGLADLIARMDRQRIESDLSNIKEQVHRSLKTGDFSRMGILGAKATQLSVAKDLQILEANYQNLVGPVMEKLDELSQDHEEIDNKLNKILEILSQLQHVQKHRLQDSKVFFELPFSRPNGSEVKLVDELSTIVRNIGWDALPEQHQIQTATSLAASYYGSKKVSQSLSVLEEVLHRGSEEPSIYFNYFQVLQGAGKNDQAVEAYQKAIAMDPKLALFPQEYQIQDIIGQGGMAFVYRALKDKANIAIKVLFLPDIYENKAKDRFLQAAQAISKLNHPYIVKIYDISDAQLEHPWIAMEYLSGLDLQKHVEKHGPFKLKKGLQIARQIAKGLTCAHKAGIIHRDLKPSNVVYNASVGTKIIDFGLAKWERDTNLTLSSESYYTIYYSAPEQLTDFHSADQRSDIYSFGKTLYYLFTGEDPYDIDWEEVPVQIRPILRKATRKTPEKRYESIEDMLKALDDVVVGENIEVRPFDEFGDSDFFPAIVVKEDKGPAIPQSVLEKLPSDYTVKDQYIISPIDNVPMVYVEAGPFLMGDDSEIAEIEEGPAHEVYLDAYLIDVYPVTNLRYRLFLKAIEQLNGRPCLWCDPTQAPHKVHIPQYWYNLEWNLDDYPVVGIDWWDAFAYAQWAGKLLPTEAQWEKAARGNDGRFYPWGNEPPTKDRCNFDNNIGKTTKVGIYKNDRSFYGVSDMVGNVWEWCEDWFDPLYYKKSPYKNPKGPATGKCRVGRGGSWQKGAQRIRTTTRGYGPGPDDRRRQLGFRTVKLLT